MLRWVHLDEMGCVTLKGAHEWRLPIQRDRFTKHSIERNTYICFDLIAKGQLHVAELISREIAPEQAPDTYLELNRDRNACLGVIINWKE